MWFNSMLNEKPHQGLKSRRNPAERQDFSQGRRDRCCMAVVSSWLELFPSVGERTQPSSPVIRVRRDCPDFREGSEDDAKSAWPSDALGYTRATMPATMGRKFARRSKPHQKRAQFGLRSATRPHEVGIASNRRSAILR